MKAQKVVITPEHVTLLKNLEIGWNDDAYEGAPEVDLKRPYGNSDVWMDIAEILEWDLVEDQWGGSDLTREQGFYSKNPGADIATRQMLNKPPLPFTKGLRLGNMPQIRTIVDEELESVWTGKKTPQQALDSAVERGNQLLRRFEQSTKS